MTVITAVSGSPRAASSTTKLLGAIGDAFARRTPVDSELIELAPLAVDLAVAGTGGAVSPQVTAALERVSTTELLVVGTPIYRGSYTGLFKLFFDLVDQRALAGTPVLLTAGGGSDAHSLAIDHELRPLFAFFGAATLPIGIYTRNVDFANGVPADDLRVRIESAVDAAVPWIPAAERVV